MHAETQTQTDTDEPHPAEQGIDEVPRDVYAYQLGVQRLYVRDEADGPGARLYKRSGTTDDVEEMADHDGHVLFDGDFRWFEADERSDLIYSYHPFAGRRDSHVPHEPAESEAILLEEVDKAGV